MTELTQHRAPLWAQLSIGLTYLIILALFGSLGESSVPQIDPNNTLLIVFLKVMQVILVAITFIVPVILFSSVIRSEKIKFLQLQKFPKWQGLIIALTICIIALPLVSYTAEWNSTVHFPDSLKNIESWMRIKENAANETIKIFFANNTLGNMISNLFVVAFMAGLSEEIFFRGFIQKLFIENKINHHLAIWITAILFSAIHLQFFGFVPRVLLGAVLGYLYFYSGNLWLSIIAHTVNNGFAVVMAYVTGSIDNDPISNIEGESMSLLLALFSGILITVEILFLKKYYKNSTVEN
jgi:membrane protease YdiL (CAAX protease family)